MTEHLKTITPAKGWRPDSWQQKPAGQQASYPDNGELKRTLAELAGMPPLVTSWEILSLKEQIAEAQAGKRFLLQGGDCAEVFRECESSIVANRLKVLLQMSLILLHGLEKPVLRIGRFAGQYAKPRSADMESRDGISLPSYRGDLVNAPEFTEDARRPDPSRLLKAHACSAVTMNFVRAWSTAALPTCITPNTGIWAGSSTRPWRPNFTAFPTVSASRCALSRPLPASSPAA
jgi:3-deoxy-7-phosphoheptulonate synthase